VKILKEVRKKQMIENLFAGTNKKTNRYAKVKNAKSLAAVTHTHTHIVF